MLVQLQPQRGSLVAPGRDVRGLAPSFFLAREPWIDVVPPLFDLTVACSQPAVTRPT